MTSASVRVASTLKEGLSQVGDEVLGQRGTEADRAQAAALLADLDGLWALTLALSALAGLPVPELQGYDQLVRDQAGNLASAPGVPELLRVVRRAAAPGNDLGLAIDTVVALRAVGPAQLVQLVQLPAFSALRRIAGPAPAELSARPAAVPPLRDPSLSQQEQAAYNHGVSDGRMQVRYIRAPYEPGPLADAYTRGYEVGSQQAAEPAAFHERLYQPPIYQPPIYQPPVPPSVYTDSSAPPLSTPAPPGAVPPPPPAAASTQAGGAGVGLLLVGGAALIAAPLALIWVLRRRQRR